MCGIFGYYSNSNNDDSPHRQILQSMGDAIYHRGPDDCGYYLNQSCFMGMRRLAIIDLASGNQPMSDSQGNLTIVFNGEIYNYQKISQDLKSQGVIFKTKSDTECILNLFKLYGAKCLDYLEGMFVFAIHDSIQDTLFIARDRMGEKPLHYAKIGNSFIFGSEIKSILKHPKFKKNLNIEALYQYLSLEYVPSPNSLFDSIFKLMPGHYMLIDKTLNVKIQPYWTPKISDYSDISLSEAIDHFNQLVVDSISNCLISEVPLGVFLSGGLDSSLIAYEASSLVKPLKSFSIGFENKSFDESGHARAMAKYLNLEHHNFTFTSSIAIDSFNSILNLIDEPIGDASIIPSYFLSKMARQQVTVALAGEGGDELFGGYPTYLAHNYSRIYNNFVPNFINQNLISNFVNFIPVSHNNLSFDYKLKRFLQHTHNDNYNKHLKWMGSYDLKSQSQILLKPSNYANEIDLLYADTKLLLPENNLSNFDINKIMQLDMASYLPDDLLVKSDRSSMMNSLELRLPLLNHKIVEFALSLPSNLKIKNSTTKYLIRKAYLDKLPQDILNRPKKGFGIPVAAWLNNEFKELVDSYLCENFIKKQGLLNFEYVRQMLYNHQNYKKDHRKELWTLLMFQSWFNKFFN